MGFFDATKSLFAGEGFETAFGKLYIGNAEIEAAKQAENRLDQMNREGFDKGKYTSEEYIARTARLHTGSIDELLTNPETSPWAGFKEGAAEGAANIQGAVRGGLAWPINFAFKMVPWQVWLLGGLFLAWKLGWLKKLFAPK